MTPCVFIGDEVSAAGVRLAGIDVQVPGPGKAAGLFIRVLAESRLVLVTAEVAGLLPGDILRRAQVKGDPPILVMPDVRGRSQPADLASLMRRELGMAE